VIRMPDDDDALPPVKREYDDKTAHGRINGRDRRKYAHLWGIDLDRPAEDDCISGQREFDIDYMTMSGEHYEAEGPVGDRGRRKIDLEQFAAAWRPMTLSEFYEEEIFERERAEAERLRQRAEAEAARRRGQDDLEVRDSDDPDPDPETGH